MNFKKITIITLLYSLCLYSTFHGSLRHSDSVDGTDVVSAVPSQPISPVAVKTPALSSSKSPLLATKPLLPKLSPIKEPQVWY